MKRFVLVSSGQQYSRVSSWEDMIFCTILKDDSISLRACQDGEGGTIYFNTIKGIRKPKQFIHAYNNIDHEGMISQSMDSWYFPALMPELYKYVPLFALLTYKLSKYNERDENELNFSNLSQNDKAIKKIDADFFMSFHERLLISDLTLPSKFEDGLLILTKIFNYAQKYLYKFAIFPNGNHKFQNISINFKNKKSISKQQFIKIKKERIISDHIMRCKIIIKNYPYKKLDVSGQAGWTVLQAW